VPAAARPAHARSHFTVAGTPEQIADMIDDWFSSRAADGFNVMPPILPALLNSFVDEVVPILQKRGLFITDYAGRTLRYHYALARPPSQFFAECQVFEVRDIRTAQVESLSS
jgi:hypothetical protein